MERKKLKLCEMIKLHLYEPPGKWTAKPFFKKGVMVLTGPLAFGKKSLCVNLALANKHGKELWPGGPKGDKRNSLFFCGGIIETEHVFGKLRLRKKMTESIESITIPDNPFDDDDDDFEGGWVDDDFDGGDDDDDDIFEGGCFDSEGDFLDFENYSKAVKNYPKNKNTTLLLKKMLEEIQDCNPAFAFFDLKYMLRYELKNITKILNDFIDKAKNIHTTIVCLATTSAQLTELKSLPILNIKKTGEDRFLIKKSGFLDSPHGVLRFKIEHKEDCFLACDLKYLENLSQVKGRQEWQEARFREIVAQFIAEGQPIFTAELKAMARKAGISTYFLAKIHWPDYGLIAKGQGFGGNYRQVLVPIQRH